MKKYVMMIGGTKSEGIKRFYDMSGKSLKCEGMQRLQFCLKKNEN